MNANAPSVSKTKSVREGFHEIIDGLCGRFSGLSPFEVMNTDLQDVYTLYVDVIIHDNRIKKTQTHANEVWVTSENATWH